MSAPNFVNGVPTLSVTELQEFRGCRRRFEWGVRERWSPRIDNSRLVLGTGVHYALEAYYKTKKENAFIDPAIAFEDWYDLEYQHILEANGGELAIDINEELVKVGTLGKAMLSRYHEWAAVQDKNLKVVLSEERLRMPVPRKGGTYGVLTGRLDGIWQTTHDGRYWVAEFKTASSFDVMYKSWLELDDQLTLYLWLAANWLWKNVDKKAQIAGSAYTVVRKQDPATARTPIYFRELILRDWRMVENYVKYMSDEFVEAMNPRTPMYPNPHFMDCYAWCMFRDPCLARSMGLDYKAILESNYVKYERR
jgi:PD-(D/E)XK nuclease superfamily